MFGQCASATAPQSHWFADSVTRNGDGAQMHDHVRIAACDIVADENTLSGSVRLNVIPRVDPLQ
jgi:hypothetical protein